MLPLQRAQPEAPGLESQVPVWMAEVWTEKTVQVRQRRVGVPPGAVWLRAAEPGAKQSAR